MSNKIIKVSILAIFLLFTVSFSLAQSKTTKGSAKSTKQTKVDLGKLRQNTYTNDFFAIKIEFPYGWLVGDNTLEAQLMQLQNQSVKARDPKNQKAITQAVSRLTPLLGGYRALPGSVIENSNLKITVEKLAVVPKIKTSRDYLNQVTLSLTLVKLPIGFTASEIKSENINGKEIEYIETNYQNNRKRNYVLIRKGFAVLITIDSFNQKDFDELHQILKGSNLNYQPSVEK